MENMLHREFDVVVGAAHPWGIEVRFEDGAAGLIDNTKNPFWLVEGVELSIGNIIHVVVLDDARDPVRVSALQVDIDIARVRRMGDRLRQSWSPTTSPSTAWIRSSRVMALRPWTRRLVRLQPLAAR